MPYTPETPGKDIVFTKPGIPSPAWDSEDSEISKIAEGKAVFKGEFTYQDNEAGIVLNDLHCKGYYIQHVRSGTKSADTSIRAFYNNEEILTNIISLNNNAEYSTAEMFIRSGMWVCQSTLPATSVDVDSAVQSGFSRALIKDEPYIDALILGTSGAASGTYRVWLYE